MKKRKQSKEILAQLGENIGKVSTLFNDLVHLEDIDNSVKVLECEPKRKEYTKTKQESKRRSTRKNAASKQGMFDLKG